MCSLHAIKIKIVLWKGRSQVKSKSDLEPNCKKDASQSECQRKPWWSPTTFKPSSPSVRVASDKFIPYHSPIKGGKVQVSVKHSHNASNEDHDKTEDGSAILMTSFLQ